MLQAATLIVYPNTDVGVQVVAHVGLMWVNVVTDGLDTYVFGL